MVSVTAAVDDAFARSDARTEWLSIAGADAGAVLRHDIPDAPADRVPELCAVAVSNPISYSRVESGPEPSPIRDSNARSDAGSDTQPVWGTFCRTIGHADIQPDCFAYRRRSVQHAGSVDDAISASDQVAITASEFCE